MVKTKRQHQPANRLHFGSDSRQVLKQVAQECSRSGQEQYRKTASVN